MNSYELISLAVSAVGVISFAAIFTILYFNYAHSTVGEYQAGTRDVELIEDTIFENINSGKTRRKIWIKVKQAFFGIFIAILIPFLAISVISKFRNGVVMLFDRGFIAVATGSMSEKHEENTYLAGIDNQIPTYSMIVLEKVESMTQIQKYDVIAFVNDKGENIIHRIVDVDFGANGPVYTTRGDSNNANDSYKPSFDDILGKYTGESIPYLGLFAMFLQSYAGIVTIAAVIYCLIMIEVVGDKIYKAREKRLDFLDSSMEFKKETVLDDNLDAVFVEKVRYKQYIYIIEENGTITKCIDEDYKDEDDPDSAEEQGTPDPDEEETPEDEKSGEETPSDGEREENALELNDNADENAKEN